MALQVVRASEVSRSFSALLNKVYYQKNTYAIKRGKVVIAILSPPSELEPVKTVRDFRNFLTHMPSLLSEDSKLFAEQLKKIKSNLKVPKNPWH